MKLRILIALFCATAGLLRAITPAPYTVGVDFSVRISGGLAGGDIQVFVYDETGNIPGVGVTNSGTSPVESGLNIAWLRPGREYVVFVVSNGNPNEYWTSFRPPDGYRLRIAKRDTSILWDSIGGTGSLWAEDYRLELLPSGQGVGGMMGEFKGIEFGKSVTWEAGLGALRTGRSAGAIVYREPDLSSSPAHRSKLHYSPPPHDNQAYPIMNGPSNQYLSQVQVPQGVVDIVDINSGNLADGFEMRFYAYTSVTFNYGTNRWDINGGATPWKTIKVEPDGSNKIKVTETEGTSVRVSVATAAAPSSGAYTWTAQMGDNSGSNWLRTVTHTSSVPGAGVREVVEEVRTGGTGGTVVGRTKYRYESFAWGEEVTKVIGDPTSAALETVYTYHTNSSYPGNYRKVRSVTSPTGSWSAQEFYDNWEFRGYPKYEYAPFLDSPSSVTLNPASGQVTYREYTLDWAGTLVFPTLVESKVNNTLVSKTTYSDGANWPFRLTTVNTYTGASTYLTSYEETHRADSYPGQAGFAEYVRTPSGLEIVSIRDRGTWTPGNWPSATFSPVWNGTAFRELKITGTTSSSGATQRSSFDGQNHKAIYMVPYQSTVEATYRNASGGIIQTETYVYTGGSSYERIGVGTATFDVAGRMTASTAKNGATSSWTYSNGLLQSSTDAEGIETQYSNYDALWRATLVTKVGVSSSGGYAAQGSIYSDLTFDGMSRVRTSVVKDHATSPSLTLTTSTDYDLAGRLEDTTAPGGYVTSYGYSNGGRTVTTTFPGGATSIADAYLDGGPKTLTGTGVVHKSWSRSVSSGNNISAVEYLGGGSTWLQTVHDWAGRLARKQHPGGDGTDYYEDYAYYSNGLLGAIWHSDGSADRRFEYDNFGRLVREGLDIGANGALDLASNDRITEKTSQFINGGSGDWWLQTTSKTWATLSSGTSTTLSTQYDRVANFSGTKRAETHHYDINGNFSAVIVHSDPSTKISTKETLVVGSGTSALERTPFPDSRASTYICPI